MSNVDTRLQKFYNKGYRDAITDNARFVSLVIEKFGYLKMENQLTLEQFLAIMLHEFNKAHDNIQP